MLTVIMDPKRPKVHALGFVRGQPDYGLKVCEQAVLHFMCSRSYTVFIRTHIWACGVGEFTLTSFPISSVLAK